MKEGSRDKERNSNKLTVERKKDDEGGWRKSMPDAKWPNRETAKEHKH